jgi:hypothetical protein
VQLPTLLDANDIQRNGGLQQGIGFVPRSSITCGAVSKEAVAWLVPSARA